MNFKKIILILRKLGIFRAGTFSWKGDLKDTPIQMIMDDVYDEKKDLITKKDIKKTKEKVLKVINRKKKKKLLDSINIYISKFFQGKNKKETNKIFSKTIHVISITILVFTLLLFIINDYMGIWFWLDLLLWYFFITHTKLFSKGKNYSFLRVGMVFVFLIVFTFVSIAESDTNTNDVKYSTITSPIEMVDLAMEIEDEMQIENVRISETNNKIIEMRIDTPKNISPEAMYMASSYILKYLDERIDEKIKAFRIIFTVNFIDGLIIESDRGDIKDWQNGKITDEEFIKKMKKINLIS